MPMFIDFIEYNRIIHLWVALFGVLHDSFIIVVTNFVLQNFKIILNHLFLEEDLGT